MTARVADYIDKHKGELRVPAMIRFPGKIEAGVVRDQAGTACDVMPTVLDLCGIDAPKDVKLDVASLLPIITDDAPSHHAVMHWQWMKRWAVRDGDWKLISGDGKPELVNLADDEPERTNHAADQPDLVKRLTGLHKAWAAEVMP